MAHGHHDRWPGTHRSEFHAGHGRKCRASADVMAERKCGRNYMNKSKELEGLGPYCGTQPCVDDPFVAHKSKKNKPDGASCETTTMDDLLGDIDQRKVVGGHVHTKVSNLFKNKQEAYTKFGKDWKDRLVNGVVMNVEVRKTSKGGNYTYVAALYEIAHNVTIDKELSIGLVKSGLAPGQEDAAHKPAPGPKCRLGSKGGQLTLVGEKFVPKRGEDGLTPGERAAQAAKYIDMKKGGSSVQTVKSRRQETRSQRHLRVTSLRKCQPTTTTTIRRIKTRS